MCRLVVYKGADPILLSHLLTRPAHSIINQSFDSRLRLDTRRPMNGDGFGVGYYTDVQDPDASEGPCIYKDTTPAWNNNNLEQLASQTKSRLIFAHVRASTAGALAETNCHPFVYGRFMFMHNGGVSEFGKLKRTIVNNIRDPYFLMIQGGTDSEWLFALYLNCLHDLGVDPGDARVHVDQKSMRAALFETLRLINKWSQEASVSEPSLLNCVVTEGNTVVASRYVSSKTQEAASLHFSSGSRFFECDPGQYKMERKDRRQNIVMIASEPLTFERNDWICIPTNTIITVERQNVLFHPVVDEFYQSNPSFRRSSTLAASKGLISPEVLSGQSRNLPPLEREARRRDLAVV